MAKSKDVDAQHDAQSDALAAERARRAMEHDIQFLVGYRCMQCYKKFYLPSLDCADAIIAGLTCPRCGDRELIAPCGWCKLIRSEATTAPLAAPLVTTPGQR